MSVAYEQHYTHEKYEAQRQKDCVALSVSPEEKHACDKEAQSRKDYAPWWYVLFAWPEGITTWAIIATGFIIAWQSSATSKAASAAADSANAAYGSVRFAEAQWELMKEKERARLDIQTGTTSVEENDPHWHLEGTLKGRNIGQSRAFIIQSFAKLTVKAPDAPYPEYESYGQIPFGDSFVDSDPSNAFSTLNFWFYPESEDKLRFLAEDLHAARRALHLYGFIDYETLGMRFRKEFGFVWTVIDPNWYMGGLVGEEGPLTDARKITMGYWSVDSARTKPEYQISREQDDIG